MRQNSYNYLILFLIISIFSVTSFAQKKINAKNNWLEPLNIGLEYSNISHFGPVFQYNVFNTFSILGKLEYNSNVKNFYLLPGIKHNLYKDSCGLNPFIELQYSKLDYIQYDKMYYNGMEVVRICQAWDYDLLT
ncbi:MAG: hypothetical protein MUP82_04440, partial [Candidatus Marinimicrobia bacterium]|nr:hypothetical protein [Candidatus Neomarinimicrobiota bacterium]